MTSSQSSPHLEDKASLTGWSPAQPVCGSSYPLLYYQVDTKSSPFFPHCVNDSSDIHLLLKYHAKASAPVTCANGVGTSAIPGRATGCRRYTAAQMF